MRLHKLAMIQQAADVCSADLLHEIHALADKATDAADRHEDVMALYCEIREAVPVILELTETLAPILEKATGDRNKIQELADWNGRIHKTGALLPNSSREAEMAITLLVYEGGRKLLLEMCAVIDKGTPSYEACQERRRPAL
jgi:hypothetical protein